jgi:Cu-processing system permease protein
MLGRTLAIALNTYRESVRARILLGLAGVALAVSLYSLVVGAYTLRNAPRVVSNLGTASISLFSLVVAIVVGVTSLHRELEMKTIFPILARPLSRGEYVVGKFAGTLLVLAVFIAADAGAVLVLSGILGGRSVGLSVGLSLGSVALFVGLGLKSPRALTFGSIPWAFVLLALGVWLSGTAPIERRVVLSSALLTLLEAAIITALATLFSAFSTPFVSAVLTVGVFIIGRQADLLAKLPVKFFGQLVHDLGALLSKVVPNLQLFVPARPLLAGESIDVSFASYAAMAALTSLGWTVGLLTAAVFIFKRRDFL